MRCNMCGETYQGLAGDCACTSYGEPRPGVVSYEELRRQMYAEAKKAEIARLTIEAEAFARAKKGPGTGAPKPIEPIPPLSGRAPLVLEGEV